MLLGKAISRIDGKGRPDPVGRAGPRLQVLGVVAVLVGRNMREIPRGAECAFQLPSRSTTLKSLASTYLSPLFRICIET